MYLICGNKFLIHSSVFNHLSRLGSWGVRVRTVSSPGNTRTTTKTTNCICLQLVVWSSWPEIEFNLRTFRLSLFCAVGKWDPPPKKCDLPLGTTSADKASESWQPGKSLELQFHCRSHCLSFIRTYFVTVSNDLGVYSNHLTRFICQVQLGCSAKTICPGLTCYWITLKLNMLRHKYFTSVSIQAYLKHHSVGVYLSTRLSGPLVSCFMPIT